MSLLDRVKEVAATIRLRRGIVSDPTRTSASPPPIVEQQRIARTYTAANPAAAWSDDVTRANAQIAADYEAELARRTALMELGEYRPRFGSPEADMAFEMRTVNVTGLAPAVPVLTPVEFKQARQVSALSSEIQDVERQRTDNTIRVPSRPTRREILDAAGGDEARADQLEARVVELFGPPVA